MPRKNQNNLSRFSVFLAPLLFILSLLKIYLLASYSGFFIDEIGITHAAVTFFEKLDYTTPLFLNGGGPFGPYVSVGLPVSWLGGLLSYAGASLFVGRLATALFVLLQLGVLLTFVFRHYRLSRSSAALAGAVILALLVQLPYWHGFILNLGELPAAIWIAAAVMLLFQNKDAGFALLGVAVWFGKFLYAPFAGLILIAAASRPSKLRNALLLFFLPLGVWLAFIAFRYDAATAQTWLRKLFAYIGFGNSGLASQTVGVTEWSNYGFGTKVKILGLLWGPIVLFGFLFQQKVITEKSKFTAGLATCGALLTYFYWYFFVSPTMWARHIQPALYLGLGFMVFQILEWNLKNPKLKLKQGLVIVAITLLVFELSGLHSLSKTLPFKEAYPRHCRGNLLKAPCM